MLARKIISSKLFIFIHILFIFLTYLMAENENETKCCRLNFTECFVSYLGVPDHYHKRLSTCHDVSFVN